jgi:hypothetical protein
MYARALKMFAVASSALLTGIQTSAQSAQVTVGTITRTVMVKSQYGTASIFSIDVDKREYWITAKHVLTGAKHPPFGSVEAKEVTLSLLSPDASAGQLNWVPEVFSVIDPGKDIDIVVLAPKVHIVDALVPPATISSVGAPIGGDCEFLGYPGTLGGGWKSKWEDGKTYWFPFIKHCTISGQFIEPLRFWVLDGINNEGFSGGPVVILTGAAQEIMAVISCYLTEPADVVSVASGPVPAMKKSKPTPAPAQAVSQRQQVANVNSGFIIAFDIDYALDAIKKNPIGPLREPK